MTTAVSFPLATWRDLVYLLAVAGFAVIAQRRLRALGMLGALGATDRHVRLVMLANGAAVGACAALVGTAVGLAGWFAFAPALGSIIDRRIDRFNLPWWAIATAMALAFVTAVAVGLAYVVSGDERSSRTSVFHANPELWNTPTIRWNSGSLVSHATEFA